MAKKKGGAKKAVSRAGRYVRKKAAGKFNIMEIAMANGGGFAAAAVVDAMDKANLQKTSDKQMPAYVSPLAAEAAGLALLMFGGEKLKPLALGMVGGAAALGFDDLKDLMKPKNSGDGTTNGTSSINAVDNVNQMFKSMNYKGMPGSPAPYMMSQANNAKFDNPKNDDFSYLRRFSSMMC